MADKNEKFELRPCLISMLKSDTHALLDWLENVIEEYLIESKNMIDTGEICSLCLTMLTTYKVCNNSQEATKFCESLANELVANRVAQVRPELFPPDSSCLALYHEDGLWYPAKVLEVQTSHNKYSVIFDGYGNIQEETDRSEMKMLTKEEEKK